VPRGADHDGLVDLASNDYLGLCRDQRLTAAAAEAARAWGTGSTGSRLVTGTTTLHARLEARLAVLAAPEVIGTLVDTGRGFVFDTGLAPPSAGAALAALEVVAAEPELGARARAAAVRLATIAAEEGLRVSAPDAAVLAVTVGESAVAVRSQKACAAYGVRVGCFRPPSVPRGQACLRLAGRASLTEDDFAAAARALAAVRDRGKLQHAEPVAAAPRHSPFMLSTI
jgi:8-amino-7-oxononanoate synthase